MTHAINQAILDNLGLRDERNLTEVTLKLLPNELPQLVLKRQILAGPREIHHTIEWFKAVRAEPVKKPEPFDLDAACAEALERINALAAKQFAKVRIDIAASFQQMRTRQNAVWKDVRHGFEVSTRLFAARHAIDRRMFGCDIAGVDEAVRRLNDAFAAFHLPSIVDVPLRSRENGPRRNS
jgi:hypothetical protein